MGWYIQTPDKKNKSLYLIDRHDAEIVLAGLEFSTVPSDKALICVVENEGFDAAGVVVDEVQFKRFTTPDVVGGSTIERKDYGVHVALNPDKQRPRTWLLMDKTKAHELCGYTEAGS